ncbi:MAG: ABC transporter ATP-binding protein [Anaerolineales bacterium]
MISTKNLTKLFKDFVAVEGVTLHVKAGEVLALLGPNGAGKTTTVRMLTTVLRPTAGRAWVAGYDILEEDAQVRRSVGILTENHGLYQRMQVKEYLDFFGRLYGMSLAEREERIQDLLHKFGLDGDQERRIGEFSKGMRQKLSLARALLHSPPVLLLDEPTSAMDPESARLVRDAIKKLRSEERAIIVCTHNLSEAEELADKIAIIRRGVIIAHGTPQHLKQHLLGPGEYEVRLRETVDGQELPLPEGVEITQRGRNWFRYRTDSPDEINPSIMKSLLSQEYSVTRLEEVKRSLESVYLEAVHS